MGRCTTCLKRTDNIIPKHYRNRAMTVQFTALPQIDIKHQQIKYPIEVLCKNPIQIYPVLLATFKYCTKVNVNMDIMSGATITVYIKDGTKRIEVCSCTVKDDTIGVVIDKNGIHTIEN